MRLTNTHAYLGPNRWSRQPTLQVIVEFASTDQSLDQRAGDLAETIRDLHTMAGVATQAFSPERLGLGSYLMGFEFEEEALIKECINLGIELCHSKPSGQKHDLTAYHRRMVDLADDIRLGPSSRAILRAATARGIPYFRLNQGSLVQFGEGIHQRRTWTAETDATSAIAESIASDKQLTRSLLAAVGVNVPAGRSVTSREDAWLAAQEVGVPVVVKPRNANHAVGVSLDLSDQQAVLDAYDWACQAGHTKDVLVEQYIHGDHHRLLVIGGELVAAAKGQREYVFGDGTNSVRQLVDILNSDPRRGENYTDQLGIVKLDDAALIELRKQGLDANSIPDQGRQVLVCHVGDLIEDCTDKVHPSTREVAILAARTIGLDIAGMDAIINDISQPLSEQRGCIIEVNAGPSLTPHVAPLIGKPRPVGEAVLNLIFPPGSQAKIPTVVFVQTTATDRLAVSLAHALRSKTRAVGIASDSCQPSHYWPVQRKLSDFRQLLMHPQLTVAIIEATTETIAECGLLCEHAEYILIPQSLLSAAAYSPAVQACLATIRNLIDSSSKIILLGSGQEGHLPYEQAFGLHHVPLELEVSAALELLQRQLV
jgi:cyanophycin synthetase